MWMGPALRIMKLQQPGTSDTKSVYAVLLGAARLIRDFRDMSPDAKASKLRKPNAMIRVKPEKGANDGFLTVVVCTHNGCGVGAGSGVTLDYGDQYVSALVPDAPAAKRFKGALETFWAKQIADRVKKNDDPSSPNPDKDPDEAPINSPGPSKPPQPGTPATPPTPAPPEPRNQAPAEGSDPNPAPSPDLEVVPSPPTAPPSVQVDGDILTQTGQYIVLLANTGEVVLR